MYGSVCIIDTPIIYPMAFYDDEPGYDRERPPQSEEKPKAWRVEEGDELTEDDLELELLAGKNSYPVREGQPMGGHQFGKGNNTSAANDKNNPSQYAGNTNPYFDRTEPMEEHPENSNFRPPAQQGSPDYDRARPDAFKNTSEPKPERVERGNAENDRPRKNDGNYRQQQETDSDSEVNIPGPGELPDQQKVGEKLNPDEREHIET